MINLLVVVLQKSFTQQHHNHPHQPPFPLAGGDQDVAPVVRPPRHGWSMWASWGSRARPGKFGMGISYLDQFSEVVPAPG